MICCRGTSDATRCHWMQLAGTDVVRVEMCVVLHVQVDCREGLYTISATLLHSSRWAPSPPGVGWGGGMIGRREGEDPA